MARRATAPQLCRKQQAYCAEWKSHVTIVQSVAAAAAHTLHAKDMRVLSR